MKIYFTLDKKEREGFETKDPIYAASFEADSVDEITGEAVLEKVKNLIFFIEACYRILKSGGKATFTAPYYASFQAWADPRNIRGISQASLNFADKKWRDQNNCSELSSADFEVLCNLAVDLQATQRSDMAKEFWLNRYTNVVQSVMFTLTKREVSSG